MNCEDAWSLISARMDGELEADRLPALEAHLAACAACQSVVDAFKMDDSDLRRAFAPRRKAALALAGRVGAGIRRGRGGRGRWLVPLAAAAAGFLLGIFILRFRESPGLPDWIRTVAFPSAPAPAGPASPGPAVPASPAVGSVARAVLVLATGDVEALPAGGTSWEPLSRGGSIAAGARVRTPGGVLCELRAADGSHIRLAGETEAAFRAGRTIELARGRLWSSVEHGEVPFEVLAGGATITALGTKFDVRAGVEETIVTMVEGTTRVSSGGKEELVLVGERAKISRGSILKEREHDVLFATRWVHGLLRLKGGDDPELAGRLNDLLAAFGQAKMEILAEREIEALGGSCVQPLLSYVRSQRAALDQDRRAKAAAILGQMATEDFILDLIQLLPDRDRRIRGAAAGALERLTGETQGRSAAEWQAEQDLGPAGEAAYRKWLAWWQASRGKKRPGS